MRQVLVKDSALLVGGTVDHFGKWRRGGKVIGVLAYEKRGRTVVVPRIMRYAKGATDLHTAAVSAILLVRVGEHEVWSERGEELDRKEAHE